MTNQEQYELICEKAKKYDRLVGVLDKIRVEIVQTQDEYEEYRDYRFIRGLSMALGIIDKYKAESEETDI